MFDLEEYYEKAQSGDYVDNTEILQYIKSFKKVVCWGGSYLGSAIGQYLIENGVKITNFWDLRAETIKEVHGVKCIQPFTTEDKDNTLVIFCIGNNIIKSLLLNELKEKGYNNVVRGDYLFMGTVCPFDKSTGIESAQCQGTMCCRALFCERLGNIVRSRKKAENELRLLTITLVVNQKCSLHCKCCTSYMNEYPVEERINIPLERVEKDIDLFFDAMDSVGAVTIMGGEPFMHPDISKIVRKLLTKNNFGLVSIATSGTYPIKDEQLEGLDDPRVNISFSNYEHAIAPGQVDLMYKNIEKVKAKGISYTVGVTIPEWSIPSTLYNLGESEETLIAKKRGCTFPIRCMMVKNGKLHACDFAMSVYCLHIGEYEKDYVELDAASTDAERKEMIRDYIDQPYYPSCGHCAGMQGLTSKAAEQGYMDFKKPIRE